MAQFPTDVPARPAARGKFLWAGEQKLYVKGVTYGTFRPRADGVDYPEPEVVERDFAAMARAGFNSVRTYTVPPRDLLDRALRHGLRVMVGHPWEQHVAFLDDRQQQRDIERRVRAGARACAGHPALLCHAVGNEIPASIVRWHGRERVARWLERLHGAVKDEDPEGLVTYVNFPTTEYLDLPFLDLCAFNVYLEQQERLESYLARLQVIAGDRPLLMAEIGLDSRRNGERAQAESLQWQLRTAFRAGAAGATVFAWTDEWHRGGHDIEDWDFGLVSRDRRPKAALEAVSDTLRHLPLAPASGLPRFSVVICSYNGAATLAQTLEGVARLDYPDYEVVVVDDGSTDATADIARAHGVRLISTPNCGLSSARNTGAEAATGDVVAYLDDDAWPDPQWLTYLAHTYTTTDHAAVGGPNVPPPGASPVAACVAGAPGGPVHVLLSDTVAEHIPGCNMTVRRETLLALGGFDTRFRVAGDDVDLCWRIQEAGATIGFSPAAMVWHHRRGSVRAFWRQQRGYGRAEAMLERKWPEKYNRAGHVSWGGRIYAPGGHGSLARWRVYYGTWGSGFFQRLYKADRPTVAALPLMPEWLLVIALLAVLTGLGVLWAPLHLAAPLLVAATAALIADAWLGARGAPTAKQRALTALLHLVHSAGRLQGRLTEGLTPWRRRARLAVTLPHPRTATVWSEDWQSPEERLEGVEDRLRPTGTRVRRGGDFDRWDLEVRGGALGCARLRMAVEEHGAGRQLLRFRLAPRPAPLALATAVGCALAGASALADGASTAGGLFVFLAIALAGIAVAEACAALAATEGALAPPPPTDVRGVLDTLRPGARIAVIGSSGSGRRTLADLLAALYVRDGEDDDGAVRSYPGGVGVVLSDPVLLPVTLAQNIAAGRPDATGPEIEAAARAAGLDTVIASLPYGYDTPLALGRSLLSQDALARLAVARAFLQDPALLVLAGRPDTNGLAEPMRRLMRDRVTLIVSEDAPADETERVLLLDGGCLVEPVAEAAT